MGKMFEPCVLGVNYKASFSRIPQLVQILSTTAETELKPYTYIYTGHTQKSGAVSIVNTTETAPFFCVCPVYTLCMYVYTMYIFHTHVFTFQ